MPQRGRTLAAAGFTLLPVVLAMSLVAAIAFLLNRDNGVNANLIGTQADRERARYAAEAGLQAVNYAIQAKACAGGYPISSSPVTDSNFGGAVYSAYADRTTWSPLSPLTLTSKGTYNGASVTLTKTNAYVYQPLINGVPRYWFTQPDPVAGKDADVNQYNQTSRTENNGGDNELKIDQFRQTLIAFDLSPLLSAGSRIVRWFQTGVGLRSGATISLWQKDNNANHDFSVKLITHDWVEGISTGSVPPTANPGVTWNRWDGISPNTWPQGPGNGYDPRTLIVVTEPPQLQQPGWVDIDVTDAAAGWTSGVPGPAPTYVSATSFTLAGDQTTNGFEVGRRIRTVNSGGTIYSTIISSVFGALTTVTVINDSGTLDSGLSVVSYGLVYPNYGVWLVPFNNNTNGYRFTSSNDTANPPRRPKLTAYYLLPCGATAP